MDLVKVRNAILKQRRRFIQQYCDRNRSLLRANLATIYLARERNCWDRCVECNLVYKPFTTQVFLSLEILLQDFLARIGALPLVMSAGTS